MPIPLFTQPDAMLRFAELGRLSASLLHEITNPLTAALLHLELTDHKSPSITQARHNLKLAKQYVEAARQQVRRASTDRYFSVSQQVAQLKRLLTPLANRADVRLRIPRVPECCLYGDPVKFQHIITNLVINAIEAKSPRQPAIVEVRVTVADPHLVISVKDNGRGIALDDPSRVFETFYTTKGEGGLGIGLAMVKQSITTDFKGTISVASSINGTHFIIKLPLAEKSGV